MKIDVWLFFIIEPIEGIDISMCSMASNMFANRITIYNSPCVIVFLLGCSFYNIEMWFVSVMVHFNFSNFFHIILKKINGNCNNNSTDRKLCFLLLWHFVNFSLHTNKLCKLAYGASASLPSFITKNKKLLPRGLGMASFLMQHSPHHSYV